MKDKKVNESILDMQLKLDDFKAESDLKAKQYKEFSEKI